MATLHSPPGWLKVYPVATTDERDDAHPVSLQTSRFRVPRPPFYPRSWHRMDGVHRTDTFLRSVRLTASPSPPGNYRASQRNRRVGQAYARSMRRSFVGPDDSFRTPLPIAKGSVVGGGHHLQLHCKRSTQLKLDEARFPLDPLKPTLKSWDFGVFPSFILATYALASCLQSWLDMRGGELHRSVETIDYLSPSNLKPNELRFGSVPCY
jgi:hypothetical protein